MNGTQKSQFSSTSLHGARNVSPSPAAVRPSEGSTLPSADRHASLRNLGTSPVVGRTQLTLRIEIPKGGASPDKSEMTLLMTDRAGGKTRLRKTVPTEADKQAILLVAQNEKALLDALIGQFEVLLS